MRVAVTGTPGTGKTTATDLVESDLPVIHLNDAIREEGLYTHRDEERDSLVADLDAVREWLGDRDDVLASDASEGSGERSSPGVLVESHLAHHLDADRVVVLRCRPDELERRLRDRGEPEAKARENAESEALDVILAEAVDRHGEGSVYEIDTTGRGPEAVAADIEAVIAGTREPSAGTVSFIEYV